MRDADVYVDGDDEIVVSYEDGPENRGSLWFIPEIDDENEVSVNIVGDPEGLRYLAESAAYLADFDQEARGLPAGEHAHLHLQPWRSSGRFGDLGSRSCPVTVWRADASKTGEIYGDLDEVEKRAREIEPDESPPEDWLSYARSSLDIARDTSKRTDRGSEQALALAGHAIYCAVMAGLRAVDVRVPESLSYSQQVFHFVPDSLSLPVDPDLLEDLMPYDMARPGTGTDTIRLSDALSAADKMVAWAAGLIGM